MKKVRLLLNVLCICSFFGAMAQTDITGNVTDQEGNGIPGVNITLDGTTIGTTTDFDGNFTFTSEENGEATLVASYVGFKTVTKALNLTGTAMNISLVLVEGGAELEEIVLSIGSGLKSQKNTAVSISSFDTKALTKVNFGNQASILKSVPGITSEGGGGEVATNVFVRGLPGSGQFQFNPLMIDGMPVLSTFGLNSSAHDVYFRTDLGVRNLEFVRGGSSILYGVGSVAGLINYTSVTGTPQQKTTIRTEVATDSRYKAEFVTSGPLGGDDSDTFYALSGFYRYDEGPIKTGFSTDGFQLRGNIKQRTQNGSVVISAQYIDDRAQFFLPYPLQGSDRERPRGRDGKEILTLQTSDAADISYRTPNGYYQSPIEDGVATKGGYIMAQFKNVFANEFKLDAKVRYSRYAHQFNLFLDGSGVADAAPVETQAEYLATRGLAPTETFTYLNGEAVDPNTLLYENRILDRNRPLRELMADIKIMKKAGAHNITLGGFLSNGQAGDFNVLTRYVSEFNNRPRLVNVSNHTVNGVSNAGLGYTNRNINSSKIAVFLTDEIQLDRWNFDIGVRYERASGNIENEGSQDYTFTDNTTGVAGIDTVRWGNGSFTRGHVAADDFAVALAALYRLNDNLNIYGNFSRGYFFPELRGVQFDANGNPSSYEAEEIIQGELGLKYGTPAFSGTLALYSVGLADRRAITFENDPNNPGQLIEVVDVQDSQTVGVEATWKWNIIENLSFDGSFTYQGHEITKSEGNPQNEGNNLQRQPEFLSGAGLQFDNNKFDIGVRYNYTGEKFTSDANTIKLDGFGLANATVGYTFDISDDAGSETLRIGAQVYNIFNETGVTEGSPRAGASQTGDAAFFVGRPSLPTRAFFSATFSF